MHGRVHDPDQRHAHRRRAGRRSSRSTGSSSASASTGRRELHDAYRVDKGGQADVRQGHARARTPARRTASSATRSPRSTPPTPDHRRRGLPLPARRAAAARFMQFIPIIERVRRCSDADGQPGWRPDVVARPAALRARRASWSRTAPSPPSSTARFLIDVFEEWVRRDVGEVFVQMFDVALANWSASRPACASTRRPAGPRSRWSTTATCTPATTSSSPDYLLGNISETPMAELVASEQQRGFGLAKRDTLPAVLPLVRRALRLPRRLPQGPVHRDARRRARAELPLRRLQGLLPPRRPSRCGDVGRCCARGGRPRS